MKNLVNAGIFLLIFINILPAGFVIDTVNIGHFFSSVHMFEYASKHEFKFGLEIIDNVGPYGYLHYPYIYAGDAFWSKVFWFSLICFFYSYYSIKLIEHINSFPEKAIFLFVVIFFPLEVASPWFSFEIIPRLTILFSAIYFLIKPSKNVGLIENILIVCSGFLYAFLTLEKASNVYFIALLVTVLCFYWITSYQWKNAPKLLGVYLLGICIFWLVAGQNLSDIFNYLKSMSNFINAYQENLVEDMNNVNFTYALFFSILAAVIITFRLLISFFLFKKNRVISADFYLTILVAAIFFLSWKHGIHRGLSSYGTFLYILPILFALLIFFPISVNDSGCKNLFIKNLFIKNLFFSSIPNLRIGIFVIILMVIWSNTFIYKSEIDHSGGILHEFHARYKALANFRPFKTLAVLSSKYAKLKTENSLPANLLEKMRLARVDEFGNIPEIIFLNNLQYSPRPVPINFIVGNAALNNINGEFYQNPLTAPDFVLMEDFGLRLTDTKAYLSLLINYHVVSNFKSWLILEKNTSNWQRIEFSKLLKKQGSFGDWIPLSSLQKSFIWVEIEAESSLLGKFKSFLYKPDQVQIEISLEDGTTRTLPISLAQLRSGFLINPIIKTKTDLLTQGNDDLPWDMVKAFRVVLGNSNKQYLFQDKFNVNFSGVVVALSRNDRLRPINIDRTNPLVNLTIPNMLSTNLKLPVDFLGTGPLNDILISGLSGLESNEKESWRWAIGPSTRIKFYVDPSKPDRAKQLLLKIAFKNGVPIANQTVTIRFNSKDLRYFSYEEITKSEITDAKIILNPKEGINNIEIFYHDWNHGKKDYGSNDPRRLAVVFMHLSLEDISQKIY